MGSREGTHFHTCWPLGTMKREHGMDARGRGDKLRNQKCLHGLPEAASTEWGAGGGGEAESRGQDHRCWKVPMVARDVCRSFFWWFVFSDSGFTY